MSPTRLLLGQILIVFLIVILGVWGATQYCASALGYQPELGPAWFTLFGTPVYKPCRAEFQLIAERRRAILCRAPKAEDHDQADNEYLAEQQPCG